ncbi:MAG: 4-hydroxyphenylacetate 3-hydroxylase, partial [Betaproteobacteria bacterium]|nr:4-hydroxyphenylacetate 3-hydroxylase [Candidatus Fonsibacter lacus]
MNAPDAAIAHATPPAHLMTAADYRESLRAYQPRVFINGQRVESVADEPLLQPGINALGVTYDMAKDAKLSKLMLSSGGGYTVPRMLDLNHSAGDLLNKLEAVRVMCQETGCAQRYLAHDGLN